MCTVQVLVWAMRVLIAFIFILQTLLQVSWVRHRDIHLLTVGRYTYTSDQRFKAIHHAHSEDWILQIKYPQHRDSGIYECQVMILLLPMRYDAMLVCKQKGVSNVSSHGGAS